MTKVLALLYKNLVLTKKYVLVMLVVCTAIPLIFAQSFGDYGFTGSLILLVSIVYMAFMCLMDLTRKESEYHSAVALIGAAPHSRTAMVVSTYLYALILSAVAGLIFAVEALFVPELRGVSPLALAAVFCVLAVLVGVQLSLIYVFGFDRTRLIFSAVIVVLPILAAQLAKNTQLPAHLQLSAPGLTALLWTVGAGVLAASMYVSVRAFARAELA